MTGTRQQQQPHGITAGDAWTQAALRSQLQQAPVHPDTGRSSIPPTAATASVSYQYTAPPAAARSYAAVNSSTSGPSAGSNVSRLSLDARTGSLNPGAQHAPALKSGGRGKLCASVDDIYAEIFGNRASPAVTITAQPSCSRAADVNQTQLLRTSTASSMCSDKAAEVVFVGTGGTSHMSQTSYNAADSHNKASCSSRTSLDMPSWQSRQMESYASVADTVNSATACQLEDLLPMLPKLRISRPSASDGSRSGSGFDDSACSSSSGWQAAAAEGCSSPVPSITPRTLQQSSRAIQRHRSMPRLQPGAHGHGSSGVKGEMGHPGGGGGTSGWITPARRSASLSANPPCARALFTACSLDSRQDLSANLADDHLSVASDDESIREMNADNVLSSHWRPLHAKLLSFKYCAATSPLSQQCRSPFTSPRQTPRTSR